MKPLVFALALPLAISQAWAQEPPATASKAAVTSAFKVFWASTDCAEMHKLSDWPKLVAKMDSNDKELCESLVGMHQFVRQVDVTEVQLLPDNQARAKATVTLITEASLKQEESFVLTDGKWLLTAP